MSRVEDLEKAVSELPADDLRKFRQWFIDFDAHLWDRQIERDATAGKFDSLIEDALAEHRSGQTRPL